MIEGKLLPTLQWIMGYYEQFYFNKLDKLREMETVLERYRLPKIIQEEIESE